MDAPSAPRRDDPTPNTEPPMNRIALYPFLWGDYCFLKSITDSHHLTTLVIRLMPYNMVFATVVPAKGSHPDVIARLAQFIREAGLLHGLLPFRQGTSHQKHDPRRMLGHRTPTSPRQD